MWGKFISDTYTKVRNKADEVRHQVTQQAQKAKEVLGLSKSHISAQQLKKQLEKQAVQINNIHTLCDVYRKWISLILQSGGEGSVRYFDECLNEDYNTSSSSNNNPNNKTQHHNSQTEEEGKKGEKKEEEDEEKEEGTNVIKRNEGEEEGKEKAEKEGGKEAQSAQNLPCAISSNDRKKNSFSSFNLLDISSPLSVNSLLKLEKEKTEKIECIGGEEVESLGGIGGGGGQNIGFTFKEIFLYSSALELSLITVAKCPDFPHMQLIGPLEEEEDTTSSSSSAKYNILRLLELCLRGEQKLHREILYILFTCNESKCNNDSNNNNNNNNANAGYNSNLTSSVSPPSSSFLLNEENNNNSHNNNNNNNTNERNATLCNTNNDNSINNIYMYMSEIIRILKYDWVDERLTDLRRQIAVQVEQIKFKINHSTLSPCGQTIEEVDEMVVSDTCVKHNIRVRASHKLISLYKDMQNNLIKSAKRRKYLTEKKTKCIQNLKEALQNFQQSFDDLNVSSADRKISLQDEMAKECESILEEISETDKEFLHTEKEYESLENIYNDLKLQMNDIYNQMKKLEEEKNNKLLKAEKLKSNLQKIQKKYKLRLQNEGENILHNEQLKADISNVCTVAKQTEEYLCKNVLHNYTLDIENKVNKTKEPLRIVVSKHLAYEKSRLQHHYEVLQRYINILQNTTKEKKEVKIKLSDLVTLYNAKLKEEKEKEGKEEEEKLEEKDINLDDINNNIEKEKKLLEDLHIYELDCRHKFAKAVNQLDFIWREILYFSKEYASILSSSLEENNKEEKEGKEKEKEEKVSDNMDTSLQESSGMSSSPSNVNRNPMEELQILYTQIKQSIAPFIDVIAGEVSQVSADISLSVSSLFSSNRNNKPASSSSSFSSSFSSSATPSLPFFSTSPSATSTSTSSTHAAEGKSLHSPRTPPPNVQSRETEKELILASFSSFDKKEEKTERFDPSFSPPPPPPPPPPPTAAQSVQQGNNNNVTSINLNTNINKMKAEEYSISSPPDSPGKNKQSDLPNTHRKKSSDDEENENWLMS